MYSVGALRHLFKCLCQVVFFPFFSLFFFFCFEQLDANFCKIETAKSFIVCMLQLYFVVILILFLLASIFCFLSKLNKNGDLHSLFVGAEGNNHRVEVSMLSLTFSNRTLKLGQNLNEKCACFNLSEATVL